MAARRLPPLLPSPKQIRPQEGSFPLRGSVPIVLEEGADDACFDAARALQDAIRDRRDLELPIEGHARSEDLLPRIALSHRGQAAGLEGDRYRLEVGRESVVAVGDGASGLRYAIETLIQLIGASGPVPGCSIEDAPDFALRGVMLDVSRGKVPTAETLHSIVDRCVELKLNALMLYTEHTFRFRRHPEIGAAASPLEAETLRELDRYAAERHVQLIPSLQSLGHMDHILALPAYRELAESEMGWTICPTDPAAIDLLRDLYDEYLPNFRSRLFNANCDEPADLGAGRSAARSQRLGPGGLYLEHVDCLRALAGAHGKRTMIWGDVVHVHPERIPEIDRSLILLDWWYEAPFDYERVKRFADAGIDFAVCPGTSTWNSLFPRVENAELNITRWAEAGRKHRAMGLLVTDWGDWGHYNLQGNSWLAYAWSAQESWSGTPSDTRSFDRAFSARLFGDTSGRAARLYRALGAIHEPGFGVFNGSALQYLFFDDLERSYFVARCTPRALHRCERALERVRSQIDGAREAFTREFLTWEELSYAADASLFAVRKGRAGLRYNDWRSHPEDAKAGERKTLARELTDLARQQKDLGRRLERLWLARSRPSNFELTKRRLQRSRQALAKAARALEANRPPPPLPPVEPLALSEVANQVRHSLRPK
ncbi:MAG: family 20 glycosylhydrolase [Deltaproteobacteria bacterium]|nr:family 20 glycosylhydrolase [Deltaproteobacteria bacterium]